MSTRIHRREFLQTASLATMVAAGMPSFTAPLAQSKVQTSGPPIYLTDLSRCEPHSALSRKPKPRHWRLLDYETDHFRGIMLVAGQNTDAPEITCPLGQKGWHAIYFGIYPYCIRDIFQNVEDVANDEFRVQVRLNSESVFSLLTHKGYSDKMDRIDDFFWKYSDLTDESIVIRQFARQVFPETPSSSGRICSSTWLAYIKLVPLSENEIQSLERDRKQTAHRSLFAHNDGFDYHYYYRPTSAAEIRREIEPYRETDFSRLYWEGAQGDRCNYPTKIGHTGVLEWIEDHYAVGERLASESWSILLRQGIDPFKVALESAHEIGLEFHACLRTAGFHFSAPEDEWNTGGIYDKHPEWHCVDRQGRSTPRLSYAYEEVQEFVISLLKEMAGYPIDGVCLLYNRRPPIVEYDPPLVDGFKRTYGQDPRQLDDRDPRWLRYRSTTLTQFMRAVRKAMQEVARAQRRSKPIQVTAVVLSSERENLYYGLDLATWVKEGLVDTLIPYSSVEGGNSLADSWADPQDAVYFLKITQGTLCKLALSILPRQLSAEEYRRRAHQLYQAGVKHLFFWDANQRTNLYPSWTELRRVGHREEIAAWVQAGSPKMERPGSDLISIGDWVLRYVTPG